MFPQHSYGVIAFILSLKGHNSRHAEVYAWGRMCFRSVTVSSAQRFVLTCDVAVA